MLGQLLLALFVLGLWGLAPCAKAEPTAATVDRVLRFYKAVDFLDRAMPEIEKAMARRRKEIVIPDARANEVLSLARRIFRKNNLFTVLKHAYAKQITLENMNAFYSFQLTPPGIRLRRGVDAAFKASEKERQAYFDKESGKLLRPNRKNAINTFINAAEQGELYAALMTGSDLVIAMALNAYAPKEAREQQKNMKEKVKKRKTGYNEGSRQEALVFDFYAFRDLKNEEIDELSKFFTSPVGQAASRAFTKSLELTLESGGTTLVAQLEKKAG